MSKNGVLAPRLATSDMLRIAEYLQLAQSIILQAAQDAERERRSAALIERLDAAASDCADLRARLLALAAD